MTPLPLPSATLPAMPSERRNSNPSIETLTVRLMLLFPLLLSVPLMGCATGSEVAIPKSLLDCKAAPKVPAKGAGAKAAATFTVDLYDAHQDCYGKLGEVKGLVQPLAK